VSAERRAYLHEIERRALLRESEVRGLVGGVSHSTLWAWRRYESFPQPIRVGRRAVRYRRDEVLKWLSERPRAREGA